MTDSRPILSKEALVPVGAVVTICAGILTLHLWLDQRFDSIEDRLDRIELVGEDRFRASDMKLWMAEFARHNPDVTVPPLETR